MLYLKQLLFLLSLLFFAACSSTKNTAVKTEFPFQYQDKNYHIISIVLPEGDGVNMLTYHIDDKLIFQTRDNDMDGSMDFVTAGDVSLTSADEIYRHGIHEAIRQNKYKTLKSLRKYTLETEGNYFTIRTYRYLKDDVYNEFTITDKQGITKAILLDINADGQLNDLKFGDFSLADAQKFYTLVVETGLDDNHITTANEKLIVKKSKL